MSYHPLRSLFGWAYRETTNSDWSCKILCWELQGIIAALSEMWWDCSALFKCNVYSCILLIGKHQIQEDFLDGLKNWHVYASIIHITIYIIYDSQVTVNLYICIYVQEDFHVYVNVHVYEYVYIISSDAWTEFVEK